MDKTPISLFTLEADAKTAADAMAVTGGFLFEQGYVKDSFVSACQQREQSYPTGLPLEPPVAIPHAAPEHVVQNAVCFLRLHEPVSFRRMDDPEDQVSVRVLFNLAISSGEEQLGMLQSLMNAFVSEDFLPKCLSLPLPEVEALIQSRLWAEA